MSGEVVMARVRAWPGLAAGLALVAYVVTAAGPAVVPLSIIATTDLHGFVFPRDGAGGVALLGGYLDNLRAARRADGGGVVLVDAGDTWLGGVESDMSEGAVVVDAYNALGYAAAAIGNHDLEFGPVDEWWQRPGMAPDLRGALKARARQARFPFLAANLVDTSTGAPVAWPNVQPSALVEVAGVRVGLVGVMTIDALALTLAPNVAGLATAPLVPAIVREATALRARGAQVVVVVAHAGGTCTAFDAPDDLGSCDRDAEIVAVAEALPRGLVQAIAAGHTHDAVAHVVNGVPIVQAYSWGRAFGRIDLSVGRDRGDVALARLHPPTFLCAWRDRASGACAPSGADGAPAEYEGRRVTPAARVEQAMAPALARVAAVRARALGPVLARPIPRVDGVESPLGHLFAEAVRAAVPAATIGVSYGAGPGGLRADLAAGPLTVGGVYDVFPFDNVVEAMRLTGDEIARLVLDHLARPRWGARSLGLAGVTVGTSCDGTRPAVHLRDATGQPLATGVRFVVAMPDFLAARARRAGLGDAVAVPAPVLVRDAAARWLGGRGHDGVGVPEGRWRAADDMAHCAAP